MYECALEAFQRDVRRREFKRNKTIFHFVSKIKSFKKCSDFALSFQKSPEGEVHTATHHRETVVGMFEE